MVNFSEMVMWPNIATIAICVEKLNGVLIVSWPIMATWSVFLSFVENQSFVCTAIIVMVVTIVLVV